MVESAASTALLTAFSSSNMGVVVHVAGSRFILVNLMRVEEEHIEEEDDRETIQAINSELEGSGHIVGMAVAPGRFGGG